MKKTVALLHIMTLWKNLHWKGCYQADPNQREQNIRWYQTTKQANQETMIHQLQKLSADKQLTKEEKEDRPDIMPFPGFIDSLKKPAFSKGQHFDESPLDNLKVNNIFLHCDKCPKTFYEKSSLNMHKLEHAPGYVHEFDENTYGDMNAYDEYVEPHWPELPDGSFRISKEDEENLWCQLCERGFKAKKYLSRHLIKQHGYHLPPKMLRKDQRDLYCNICSKKFARWKYLRKHQRNMHEKPKLFICRKCKIPYTRRDNLDRHVKVCDPRKRIIFNP